MAHRTREEWLNQAVSALRPHFKQKGFPLPLKIKVSCGWPCRKALRGPVTGNRSIGQCFARSTSNNAYSEIFISPVLDVRDEVLATLVHELCHSVDDCAHGHRKEFGKIARAVGLQGKLTATTSSSELNGVFGSLQMPRYPHAELDITRHSEPTQTTRMIKVFCAGCGYTARSSRKWIGLAGAPLCPIHKTQMTVQPMTNTLGC